MIKNELGESFIERNYDKVLLSESWILFELGLELSEQKCLLNDFWVLLLESLLKLIHSLLCDFSLVLEQLLIFINLFILLNKLILHNS